MRKRRSLGSLVVLGCLASVSLGASYNWTGNGDGTSWDDEDNWGTVGSCSSPNCYPQTTADDALINFLSTVCDDCTIDLVDEEIDDLTIGRDDVTFDVGSGDWLQVDRFFAGNINVDMSLTLTGGAVVSNQTEP